MQNKPFFWKKGYSTIIWGGNKVTLQNISFLAVFSSDNFHFCGIHAYSSLNMKIGDQWSNYFSLHMQGYNALKRKMLFDEGMNFIEHCFWPSTFIKTKINNTLAVCEHFCHTKKRYLIHRIYRNIVILRNIESWRWNFW